MNSRPLTLATLIACVTSGLAQTSSFMTKPDIHGDLVVFTCEGDLWLGDLKSNTAKRITSDAGLETNAHFSPDGTQIAFSANYEGGTDVYVMPTAGGAPKRLTWDPKGAGVLGWTPDGKSIIFRSRRDQGMTAYRRIWTVPATGGQPSVMPMPRGEFASVNAAGQVAYVPISFEWANWYGYQAGAADDIWLYDPKGTQFTRLTTFAGVDTTPVWAGNKLFYVSESAGSLNLFQLDLKTKTSTQITKNTANPIRYPASDGKRVIFQAGPVLAMYDLGAKGVKTIKFDLDSDRFHTRDQRVRVTSSIQNVNIGPTGKRVLVEARGQILSVPVEQGDIRVLENKPGTRAMLPSWSPDGKKVAFVSDRSGENEIWVTDAAGGAEPKQLTNGLKANPLQPTWSPDGKLIALVDREGKLVTIDATTGAITVINVSPGTGSYDGVTPQFTFSPDSKLLAYTRMEANWQNTSWVVDLATKKEFQLGSSAVSCYGPTFSPDGKFVAYLEDRALNPSFSGITHKYAFDNTTKVTIAALTKDATSPFLVKNDEEASAVPTTEAPKKDEPKKEEPKKEEPKKDDGVDLAGLSTRLIEPAIPAGRYSQILWVPGHIVLQNQPAPGEGAANEVLSFDIESKKTVTVTGGVKSWSLSADRKKILVAGPGTLGVLDSGAGEGASPKKVDIGSATITVNPQQEWKQILEESWRITRDFFYDPGMHGVDWNAIHAKYQGLLPLVGDRNDLADLQEAMVSELGTGHAYIGNPAPYGGRGSGIGYLGADLEPAGNAVKITKLFGGDPFSVGSRSPLLEPGLNVKVGDYILAVNGQQVRADQEFSALTVGLQGQTVALTINDKPSAEGSRIVRIKLLGSDDSLRYQDWVASRTAYVKEHGGPNFGYVHVPDMGDSGVVGFVKGQAVNSRSEAVVYDFRYNGGGFVSSMILDNIRTKPVYWFKPRAGNPWTREDWSSIGYSAALCNEYNFSDGELVIETWKKMGLGPVVGKTTGGGEVGSGGGYTLIDGGSIYVPNYAAYTDGKWIIEGEGAKPDFDVDEDPASVLAGKDPQLDKAIELLKAKIAQKQPTVPVPPTYTKKK